MTRQEALDEATRKVWFSSSIKMSADMLSFAWFGFPALDSSPFIDDIRAEYRKIMQCL